MPDGVLGCISIPLDIARAIISLPAAIFQGGAASSTEVAQAKLQAVNAQRDLLQAQRELVDAKAALR
jgi:outer membrane protein TolC